MHPTLTAIATTAVLLGSAGTLTAQDRSYSNGFPPVAPQPFTLMDLEVFYAEAPAHAEVSSMCVTIIFEEGEVAYREWTDGSPFNATIADMNLPDGRYRYEVRSYHLPSNESEGTGSGDDGLQSIRGFGYFEVREGLFVRAQAPREEASTVAPWLLRAAGRMVDWLVSSASAANLDTGNFGHLVVEDAWPSFWVQFGPDQGMDDGATFWEFQFTDGGQNPLTVDSRVWLYDYNAALKGTTIPLKIESSIHNNESIVVQDNGDITLGGGALLLDRSEANLHVGATTAPTARLQATSISPDLGLADSDGGTYAELELRDNTLGFNNDGFGAISGFLTMDITAPPDSLAIHSSGNVSIGGPSADAPLHVARTQNAQILVSNSTAVEGPRTLFRLQNAGNTKFEIENTWVSKTWAFTNSGADFRMSLQDSGVVEFRVDNAGNAFLEGTLTQNSDVHAKRAIVAIDPAQILQKVAELPLSQWQYIDAPGVNHLGPMAQDFHAAFGLGAGNRGISTLDSSGVALAAIQALDARDANLEEENRLLRERLAQLERRLAALEAGR